jgi:hypothetical protein
MASKSPANRDILGAACATLANAPITTLSKSEEIIYHNFIKILIMYAGLP